MPQQPIGVAVIGAGMAGRAHCAGYRSAPTLFDPPLPPIHYAAVIDANEATAADAAERYGYERHGTDWRELLDADDVQVVSVVVANSLHREIVEALLGRRQARAVREAAVGLPRGRAGHGGRRRGPPRPRHRHGVRLPPPAGGRRHPRAGARRARRGLALQRPLLVRLRPQRPDADGLALQGRARHRRPRRHRQPPHRPRRVRLRANDPGRWRGVHDQGEGAPRRRGHDLRPRPGRADRRHEPVENDDVATFTAHFASGAVGTFSISRVAPGHANSLAFDLFAETGAAKWDMDRPAEFSVIRQLRDDGLDGYNQVLVGPAHPYLKGGVPMDFPGGSFGVGDLFGFQPRAFLEQVAGIEGGLPPVATFDDGVRDLTIIDAVIRSAAAGGAVVDLPRTLRLT